jgi:hypothetical protein
MRCGGCEGAGGGLKIYLDLCTHAPRMVTADPFYCAKNHSELPERERTSKTSDHTVDQGGTMVEAATPAKDFQGVQ